MHIGLLECDNVVGRFSHIPGGYREMFAELLAPHFADLRFSYYAAHEGALPGTPGECDAWLCTGSRYAVYEKSTWVENLLGFVRRVRDEALPFVGICFGHQVLAQALGGEVARSPYGWGVGVLELELVREESWMSPPQPRLRLHHMHADHVQRLPEGAVLLGRSAHCEVGMFRVGPAMLGIEGHPEFTPAFSAALIEARRGEIGEVRAQAALTSVQGPSDGPLAGAWMAAFIRSARR